VEFDGGLSIPLNPSLCFFGLFTINSIEFKPIPSNLLDSFRVLDYIPPDFKKIIHGYFVLLGFDVYSSKEFTEKFMLFLTFLNEELFKCHYMINGGIGKTVFHDLLGDSKGNINYLKKITRLSIGSVMRILNHCMKVFIEKKSFVREELLWKAINFYFKGTINSNEQNLIANLYSNIFNYRNLQ